MSMKPVESIQGVRTIVCTIGAAVYNIARNRGKFFGTEKMHHKEELVKTMPVARVA